jgi:carboxyl-terminal processing protease
MIAVTARLIVLSILAAGASLALGASEPGLEPLPHYRDVAQRFARYFPRAHFSNQALNDRVSNRAWTNYLASLDYERVYFLDRDIQRFRQHENNLDDLLSDGDVNFAFEVFTVYKARVRDRYQFTTNLLARGFDFTESESYRWKRKDVPWPKDEAESNELWRKRIKNEYLRRVVAREISDEDKRRKEAEKLLSTNAVPTETAGVPGTNGVVSVSTNAVPATAARDSDAVTPEEFIRKRYHQFLTLLDDSDAEWVMQKYLSAFAHAYDPHSDYMSPSTKENFNIEMKLSLEGIGALLQAEDGSAKVVSLIPGGPAARDERDIRLRPGDKIIAVGQNDEPPVDVLHWPLQKTVQLIRGPIGTRVVLVVIPASDATGATTRRVDLVRDKVNLEEQAAKGRMEEVDLAAGGMRKVGVVTLPAFYANVNATSASSPDYRSSTYDVEKIVTDLRAQGAEGVLLDLRNDGGGYLPEAVTMTGLFIPTGPTVQVKDRTGVKVLRDRDPKVAYDGPLVVLVNRLSASASEILAGALQDYGRAVIVGDSRTHGKGTVQAVVDIGRDEDLGSLKITSAKYYRVTGASTQLKGVSPDVVVPSPYDRKEYGEDNLPYPVPWSQVDEVRFTPVADLKSTVQVLRSRSEARQSTDRPFVAYCQLLARIEAINAAEELPLNIEARRKLARTEKELTDLEREIVDRGEAPEGDEEDAPPESSANRKKQMDLVLREGLQILSDLVEAESKKGSTPPSAGRPASTNLRDIVEDLFKSKL